MDTTIMGKEITNVGEPQMVSWDKAKFKRLQLAHKTASEAGETSFFMDDLAFDTKYAGYLLLYLADRLGIKRKK